MEFRFDDDQLAMRDAVRAFCADHLDLTRLAEREGKAADPATWRGARRARACSGCSPARTTPTSDSSRHRSCSSARRPPRLRTGALVDDRRATRRRRGRRRGACRRGRGPRRSGTVRSSSSTPRRATCVVVLRADRVECCPTSRPAGPDRRLAARPADAGHRGRGRTRRRGRRRPGRGRRTAAGRDGAGRGDARRRGPGCARRGPRLRARAPPVRPSPSARSRPSSTCSPTCTSASSWPGPRPTRRPPWPPAGARRRRPRGVDREAARRRRRARRTAARPSRSSAAWASPGTCFPHYFLKRAWVLEEQFGTSADHAARLGSTVGEEASGS